MSTSAIEDTRVIRGWRDPIHRTVVQIDDEPLDWESSLEVRNHSPTGVEWGYPGSGPSQLALAILLALVDRDVALIHYQEFKRQIIVPLDHDSWTIAVRDVLDWVEGQARP